jgi:hypothetical protein
MDPIDFRGFFSFVGGIVSTVFWFTGMVLWVTGGWKAVSSLLPKKNLSSDSSANSPVSEP